MSAHRRARETRHAVRRTFTAAVVALVTGVGFLAAAGPAHAAATWFVKPQVMGGSTNGATCGTTAATACATITLAHGRAAATGDTISVAAGTYIDRPVITKSVTITGAGTNALSGTVVTNNNQANTSTITVAPAVTVVLNDLRIAGGTGNGGLGGGLKIGTGSTAANVSTNNVVIDGNKAVFGGGVYVAPAASFTATGTTISAGTVTGTNASGGGIFNNSGTVNITGGAISGNTATGAGALGGGGVYSAGGTTSLTGTTVSGNSSPNGGGAAVVTLTANNVTWQNNTATTAGGGLFSNGPAISVTGGSFTGNSAPSGGGLYNAGGTTTVSGATFSTNNAPTSGGAVYNTGAATTTQLTSNTITNNTSPLGAGVYANQGTISIGTATANSGGLIQNNSASNVGGAGYSAAGATLNVSNASVIDNAAPNGGGGLGTGGTLNVTGSVIRSNGYSNFGGGIVSTGTTTINSSTIADNTGGSVGGGIYSSGGLTLTNSTVSGNQLIGPASSQQGAGLYAVGTTTTLTNSNVTDNSSLNQGGGMTATGSLTLNQTNIDGNRAATGAGLVSLGPTTITGGSISNNTAQSPTGNLAANAGGMYAGGVTTIDGTTISNNKAVGGTVANSGNGGAIYYTNALTIKNATMTGNRVTASSSTASGSISGYGGATFAATFSAGITPKLTITDTTVNGGNVSGGNAVIGGAFAVYPNSVSGGTTGIIDATRLTLSANVAAAAGGIYSGGKLTLTDSTLDQNKATHASAGNGGAVYAGSSPIVLDNTDVTGNSAATAGGGLFVLGGSTTEIRNDSTLTGNTAVSGGAIVNASTLTVKDSHVDNNDASYAGAGLYSSGATTLTDSTVDGNSAAALGGGILTAGGALTVNGGQINANDAFAGGGVLVGANSPASFDGTDFMDNTSTGASSGGGAILSAGNVTVKNATLSGNKAHGSSGYGGAIYSGSTDPNVNTSLNVASSTLTDNEAFGAAAIVAGSSGSGSTNKTSIINATITGNSSASAVGALQLYQGSTITGSTITDNTAGGAAAQNVGGIVAAAGIVGVSGSIVQGNTGKQCYAAVADGGHNLTGPSETSCGFSAAKNDVFANPLLDALADNGGQTRTRLPSPASPALDRIPANTATGINDAITGAAIALCGAAATDQRGTSRPQGARCDIGAVEKAQVAATVSGPANADSSVGNAMTPLTYTTTGSPQPTLSATGLPAGVTLVDNGDGTGTIAGTPAAGAGGSYDVVVTATNEAGSDTTDLTLVVRQAPTIGGPATDTYTVGQAGSTTFTQTTGHPLGIFSSLGALPGGVTFDGSVAGQGTYSGTPAAGTGGIYNLTVKDDNGTPPAATAPFTLTVNEATGLTGPATASFQVGTAGQSGEFVATGFPVPSFSQSGLPGGLALASTGSGKVRISGTAANGTGGLHAVTVTAQNGVGTPVSLNVSVTVDEAPELTGPSMVRFVAGTPNSAGFSSDGYPQATLTRSGALPAGVTFVDNGNGSATLSGTAPTSAIGDYTITVKAGNGISPDATQQVVIEVVPALSISTTTLPNAAHRTAYSAQVMATGGQPVYTFSISSGSLPAGLSMNAAGLITGATTANPGTYAFTVKATDSLDPAQTTTKQLSITVVKGQTFLRTAPIVLTLAPNGDIKINIALFEADLTGGFPAQGIGGQQVQFFSGTKKVCQANTDASGHVKCQPDLLTALLVPLKGEITGKYAGNAAWLPSQSSAGLIGP